MVNEHFPKVLSFDVEKLRNAQCPIETQFDHVIPPNVTVDSMMRVVIPAMLDVPQPRFRPKNQYAIHKNGRVIKASPTRERKISLKMLSLIGIGLNLFLR